MLNFNNKDLGSGACLVSDPRISQNSILYFSFSCDCNRFSNAQRCLCPNINVGQWGYASTKLSLSIYLSKIFALGSGNMELNRPAGYTRTSNSSYLKINKGKEEKENRLFGKILGCNQESIGLAWDFSESSMGKSRLPRSVSKKEINTVIRSYRMAVDRYEI